jgi:3-oxoacyl-[acyl-carrier protein] reductase
VELKAKFYKPEQLYIGQKFVFNRDVNEADVSGFAKLSEDFNPLHIDVDYAKESNYQGRIVHGAFQVGFASAMLGMHLPGQRALLGSINCRFPAPLYYPCSVKVAGEITSWNLENKSGNLKVVVQKLEELTPTAEIQMGFSLHEIRESSTSSFKSQALLEPRPFEFKRKIVLVTGAAGGLGRKIISVLAERYHIVALVHNHVLDERTEASPYVTQIKADISKPDWQEHIINFVGDNEIYGVVHTAWPDAPRGGLLNASDELIEKQFNFGVSVTIQLARFLFARAGSQGGRLIAISSTAGSISPVIALGSYSLGKAALEHTIRLLAPEMARKQITVNAIAPSFMPVGINKQASERQQKMEAAHIPLGRLCEPDDVAGIIGYLLSEQSSFVSGQNIAVAGAQI